MSTVTRRDEVVLLTGASRGIGRAIALNLAKLQYRLALLGRNSAELETTARECEKLGAEVRRYEVELGNNSGIPSAIAEVVSDFGQLNILILVAGIFLEKRLTELRVEEIEQSMQVNYLAPVNIVVSALPHLIAARRQHQQAAIIGIGSVAGDWSYRKGAAYCPTKSALRSFLDSAQQELSDEDILVSVIQPGVVNTDMHQSDTRYDPKKMLQPEDIAETVRFVLQSPRHACPFLLTVRPRQNPRAYASSKGEVQ